MTPEEILAKARELSLYAIAITDHDTIEGSKEAFSLNHANAPFFLTGIEISASPPDEYPCSGSFHVLGYDIDLDHPELNHELTVLQEARKNRNPRIIKRLQEFGFDITIEEVQKEANGGQLGRPHIARVLIKKGFVSSVAEVFDNYLAKGKPAYVDKYRMSVKGAIELIRKAGGIPVLAHPGLLNPKTEKPLDALFEILKPLGLAGLEVYYPEHSPKDMEEFKRISKDFDLKITGGTDFHGSLKPSIQMATGKGNLDIPDSIYHSLIQGR